jgi:hypothetical protein
MSNNLTFVSRSEICNGLNIAHSIRTKMAFCLSSAEVMDDKKKKEPYADKKTTKGTRKISHI